MSSPFDEIGNPVARRTLAEHDARLARLQQLQDTELPHIRTLSAGMGHPDVVAATTNVLDALGGRMHDELAEQRARLREIAEMQRREERAAREAGQPDGQ